MNIRAVAKLLTEVDKELFALDPTKTFGRVLFLEKYLTLEEINSLRISVALQKANHQAEEIQTNRELNRLVDLGQTQPLVAEIHTTLLKRRLPFDKTRITPKILTIKKRLEFLFSGPGMDYESFKKIALEDHIALHLAFSQPFTEEVLEFLWYSKRPVGLDKDACEVFLESLKQLEKAHSEWFENLPVFEHEVKESLRISNLFDSLDNPDHRKSDLISAAKRFLYDLDHSEDIDKSIDTLLAAIQEVRNK